ncbi:MAG: DUF4838 domain-containing protein [Oscillospiraceae bacterium]|jgi:hypothetical protein|nr:DUF4838 domain-containing protein [Oscillospiraceae bacterium]
MSKEQILSCLTEKGLAILNALICAFAALVNPFIGLFNPLLPDFVPTPEPPPAQVTKHSIADYQIIYPAGAIPAEVTAANTLADYLGQITGQTFSVATDTAAPQAHEILVGQTNRAAPDVAALGAEGYLIRPEGEKILITGGQPRGVLYGVYRFLEEYFDCHWYTASLRVIPQGAAEIAEVKTEQFVPALEYRETDWISPKDQIYSVANRLNGNSYRYLPPELGGNMGYSGSFAHTIINQFLRPGDFFAAHPEWYAYRESEKARVPKQLCLTNPDVLAEMIREVRGYLAQGGLPIVSVTQDDNQDYCQCANCKAVDEAEGSHAGTLIRFVNAIAADVAQEYPDALIDTFAYQYTRTPPKLVKPRDNVIVRLCSIECCFAHPLDDPDCPDNRSFAGDIKTWSQISNHLYIWDYTTNYAHYNLPFPDFQVLQENMRFFAANNVRGVYEEGDYSASECNSEFAELRAYLLARLMWNPGLDYDAEMNGFLKAYYGGGWQYIRAFLDLLADNTGKPNLLGCHRKMWIYIDPTNKGLLDLKLNQVAYADRLWEKAIELAGDETCRQNVLRSQLSWRFWKGCNRVAEFSWLLPLEQWQGANEQLFNDFKAFGIVRYSEGWSSDNFNWRFLPDPPANWWGQPDSWRG